VLGFLDALFPRCCAGCAAGPWPFCERCSAELTPLGPPRCERCGRPSPGPVLSCRDCPPAALASARAPFLYAGPAKAAIRRLKFSGWRAVAAALADAMVTAGPFDADVITWVPLARGRLAERGYDQARALAAGVSRGLGLPAAPLLRRITSTAPQARRAAEERRVAMAGAFEARRIVSGRVLLVDDVLTTGATAASCASALLASGARSVSLVTAARALTAGAPRGYTRATGSRSGLWLPEEVPR
jgi:ComF family protein